MNEYRMLVLDIDGTTVRRDGTLADEDRRAVAALIARGIKVTIATGRLFCGTEPIARALGIEGAVACMNGSEIVELATERRLRQRCLCAADLGHARDTLRTRDLTTFVFAAAGIHHDERATPFLSYLQSWSPTLFAHDDLYGAPAWQDTAEVLAVAAAGLGTDTHAVVEQFESLMGEEVETIHFPIDEDHWYLKVRDRMEDKGSALAFLADQHGLRAEECVAVGDWRNDLPMLERAGLSFAMAQGHESAHAAADEILRADSARGGAVAEVAKKVWGVRL